MAKLNYDPRLPAEPTSWTWKTVRFVIIALWIIAALWAVRWTMLDMHDDTKGMDQDVLVEELEDLGR